MIWQHGGGPEYMKRFDDYLIALCGLHAYAHCKELWGYHGNKGTGRG